MSALHVGFLVLGTFALIFYIVQIFSRPETEQVSALPTSFGITFDTAGFTVTGISPHGHESVRILWPEVERVAAYRVVYICDFTIFLHFLRSDGTGVELDFDMAGWEPFCEALPTMLPGCRALPSLVGEIADTPAKGVLYQRKAHLKLASETR